MREVLFRGFHPDENGTEKVFIDGEWIKGFWVYGCLYKQTEFYGDACEKYHIITSNESLDYDQVLEYYEVIPATVGQFTGLTDKNGNKIFEGDIVKHYIRAKYFNDWETVKIGIILFIADNCCFARTFDVVGEYCPINNLCIYEVIGNIHSNPELLKEVKDNG